MKKRILKPIVSIITVVAILLYSTFCSVVSATDGTEHILPEGVSKTIVWHSSDVADIVFEPENSGFYSLSITDRAQQSNIYIEITDITTGEPFSYIYEDIGDQPYQSEKMYVTGGHRYELACYYAGDDLYSDFWADATFCFNKVNFTPYQLPECDIALSNTTVDFKPGVKEWFCFTTDLAGDYSFNYSSAIDACIQVYDAQSGELMDERYTMYSSALFGSWLNSQQIVFTLEGNTEYYFCIEEYRESSSKVSITKNEKDIKNITVNTLKYDIDSSFDISEINEVLFNHRVEYTDGTSDIVSCDGASMMGIKLPTVVYLGKSVDINGTNMPIAGSQPVVSIYNTDIDIFYVNIASVTDWLQDADAIGDYENNDDEILNEGTDEINAYYRVKISKTGIYDFVSNDWDKINIDYMVVLDSKNNIVQYNEDQGGWPLVAGDDYAFCIFCNFKSATSGNVELDVQMQSNYLFPDVSADSWYNDPVSYAVGRGVIKGYGNGAFGPGDNIQRQDFLVMLARLDGVDLAEYTYDSEFPDVPRDSYYEAAVNWGYENGIVTGYENGKFGVGDNITREQIVAFLYRYAENSYADTSFTTSAETSIRNQYSDYKYVSDWAKDYVVWAIDKGVIKGKDDTTIAPGGNALRCEVAQILYNIFENDII